MAEPDAQQEAKADRPHEIRSVDETNADTRRGGDVRTLLSPMTVQSTSGFMGVATIGPGDRISEHYHPYSEEFIYCVRGALTAQLDGESHEVLAGQALYVPINMRHRLVNAGEAEVFVGYHLSPSTPCPKPWVVCTEQREWG